MILIKINNFINYFFHFIYAITLFTRPFAFHPHSVRLRSTVVRWCSLKYPVYLGAFKTEAAGLNSITKERNADETQRERGSKVNFPLNTINFKASKMRQGSYLLKARVNMIQNKKSVLVCVAPHSSVFVSFSSFKEVSIVLLKNCWVGSIIRFVWIIALIINSNKIF